jgi:enamine deaminase RidA (YjgF/YER057c/UK114 family)
MSRIETRLAEMGIDLPVAAAPAANYAPWLIGGDTLWISGQLPMGPGGLAHKGQVAEGALDDAKAAARLCAINILAQAKAALGDLDRIEKVLRLNGFVNAPAGFGDHPAIINGASDLIAQALGEKGKHTRIAVGVSSLPFDATVEIDAVLRIAA